MSKGNTLFNIKEHWNSCLPNLIKNSLCMCPRHQVSGFFYQNMLEKVFFMAWNKNLWKNCCQNSQTDGCFQSTWWWMNLDWSEAWGALELKNKFSFVWEAKGGQNDEWAMITISIKIYASISKKMPRVKYTIFMQGKRGLVVGEASCNYSFEISFSICFLFFVVLCFKQLQQHIVEGSTPFITYKKFAKRSKLISFPSGRL